MRTICGALKNCIQRCFRNEEDDYRQRMIELEERMLKRVSSKADHTESSNQFDTGRMSSPEQMSNVQSPKKQPEPFQSPVKDPPNRPQEANRQSNASVDSYFTIHSGSASNNSLSRRTFKSIIRRKSMSLIHNESSRVNDYKQFKEINNDNTNESQLKLSRVDSQYNSLSQAMFQWNEIEYQRASTALNMQINSTEQLKLSSNILINEAVNKLEDYYTFYFNEINIKFNKQSKQEQQMLKQHQGYFFRKYPEFKCSYHSQHDNLNASETFMMLATFQTNTSNPVQFLKWYNSSAIMSKIFHFQKQLILQNGTYPIFQIEQFGSDIKQKYTYTTVRQIQSVKFDNDPETQYVLQLDTTFRKGNNFKSLIRFSDSDNGMVQIYCQFTEKLRCSPESYFLKKWKTLDALIKDRLLKISVSRVVK